MKGFLFVFSVVGIALGGTALVRQAQIATELRNEIALLRDEVQRVQAQRGSASHAAPAAAGSSVEADAARAEIAQLREEVAALKKTTQTLARTAAAAPATAAGAAANKYANTTTRLTPVSAWKNSGRASPNAAMETLLWAAFGGEVGTIADGIAFTPTGQKKADEMYAQLSDETKAKYGSPENLLALMIAKDAANLSGMQILGERQEDSPDDVGLRIRFGNTDGQTKDDAFLVHRGTDGNWRLMLSENTVDRFSRQMLGGGAGPR